MEQMMQQMTGDMKPPKSVRPVAMEDETKKGQKPPTKMPKIH